MPSAMLLRRTGRKGVTENLSDFYLVIIGLVVLAILYAVVFNYSDLFVGSKEKAYIGDSETAARLLAKRAMECWEDHRLGADRESAICFKYILKTDKLVTEELFTSYLNCRLLPNAICGPDNKTCSCISADFEGQDQDKVLWGLQHNDTILEIAYDSNKRKISMLDLYGLYNKSLPNRPPVARAGDDKTAIINKSVTLDGSASYDPDHDPISYLWAFGDGPDSATTAVASHTYMAEGKYTAMLTVNDSSLSSSDSAVVTVLPGPKEDGEPCGSDVECKSESRCSNGHCCRQGTVWNGTECKALKQYKIMMVAVNYDSMDAFKERAKRAETAIRAKTPFKDCPDSLNVIIADFQCSCSNVDDANGCPRSIISCINQNYGSDYNMVAALNDDALCSGYARPELHFSISMGGFPQEVEDNVPVHEMGHVFGLCDEYCWTGGSCWSDQHSSGMPCYNPYPDENGLSPGRDCSQKGCQRTSGERICCGTWLGPGERDVAIMGGGSCVTSQCPNPTVVAHLVAFGQAGYDGFKSAIKNQGFECG